MSKRKRRTTEEIRKEILDYFVHQTFPRTTGQIAKAVGLNWYSTTAHLMALKADGELFHEKVGRQNQWWVEHVGKMTKKLIVKDEEIRMLKRKVKELDKEVERLKGGR